MVVGSVSVSFEVLVATPDCAVFVTLAGALAAINGDCNGRKTLARCAVVVRVQVSVAVQVNGTANGCGGQTGRQSVGNSNGAAGGRAQSW